MLATLNHKFDVVIKLNHNYTRITNKVGYKILQNALLHPCLSCHQLITVSLNSSVTLVTSTCVSPKH